MEAVNNQIKELVIELQSLAFVSDFGLAGGTNLATRFNHRVSGDIDLFSDKLIGKKGFQKIKTILENKYQQELKFCDIINEESGNQYCFLRALIYKGGINIKVEFIQNIYLLFAMETIGGVNVVSVGDIGVMKLMSVSSRKANKDVYDLDLITDKINLEVLWNLLETKRKVTKAQEHKCLFDLDNDPNPLDDLSLLLKFDDTDYSALPQRPSHSTDRLLLLPSSRKWTVARTSWKRKVRELMRNKGIEPPKIKPIN